MQAYDLVRVIYSYNDSTMCICTELSCFDSTTFSSYADYLKHLSSDSKDHEDVSSEISFFLMFASIFFTINSS